MSLDPQHCSIIQSKICLNTSLLFSKLIKWDFWRTVTEGSIHISICSPKGYFSILRSKADIHSGLLSYLACALASFFLHPLACFLFYMISIGTVASFIHVTRKTAPVGFGESTMSEALADLVVLCTYKQKILLLYSLKLIFMSVRWYLKCQPQPL